MPKGTPNKKTDDETALELGGERNPRNLMNDKPDLQNRNVRAKRGSGGRLDVPAGVIRQGYRPFWALDANGVIDLLLSRGYEYVIHNGTKMMCHAGNGDKHYLLETPQEFYDEDQKEFLAEIEDNSSDVVQPGSDPYTPQSRPRERDLS